MSRTNIPAVDVDGLIGREIRILAMAENSEGPVTWALAHFDDKTGRTCKVFRDDTDKPERFTRDENVWRSESGLTFILFARI